MLDALGEPDRQHGLLERRCQAIIEQQKTAANDAFGDLQEAREKGLGKLLWLYLPVTSGQLVGKLVETSTMPSVSRANRRSGGRSAFSLSSATQSSATAASLTAQLGRVSRQRTAARREAEKLAFLDAELARMERRVELIRRPAVLQHRSGGRVEPIDQVAADLSGTRQWIREQQQAYGQVGGCAGRVAGCGGEGSVVGLA